jgi:hypothetical protein
MTHSQAPPRPGGGFPAAPQSFWSRLLTLLFLGGLYVLGVVHWVAFFNCGRLNFQPYDWDKEYKYYHVLGEALRTRTMPWHVSEAFHGTDRFLGLPETNLSPQVLLLPLFGDDPEGVGRFLVFHVLVLYSAGYVGLLWLRRRYRLSWAPFACLYLLIELSGYITSHLSVGHSMWSGYFLLPFFVLYVLEMAERPGDLRPGLKLALVLFVMNLQGSFHMVIWCWMFLLLGLLFERPLRPAALAAVGLSFGMSLFRFLPAVVAFWGFKDYRFLSGYRSLADMLDAFITLRDYDYPHTGITLLHGLDGGLHEIGWWEYDLYLGLLGFAFLAYFGIYRRFDREPPLCDCCYAVLDMPLAVLAILSLSCFYAFIGKLPLPLFNGERVPSRFLVISVVVLTGISAIRMQRLLERVKPNIKLGVLLAGGVLEMLFALANHSYVWRIALLEERREREVSLDIAMVERADALYVASFWVGLAGSVLAAVVWAWLWAASKKNG